jgi:chitinase
MTVTENGVTYKANWWTQGADPAHNNGGLGTGQPWTIVATTTPPPAVPTVPAPPAVPPTSGATTWSASSIYTASMTTTENGFTYKANWWTQGADPAHNNGGPGTGQPWTIVATASAPPGMPTAPTIAPSSPPPPAPSAPSTGGSPSREFTPYIDMAMPQDANLSASKRKNARIIRGLFATAAFCPI